MGRGCENAKVVSASRKVYLRWRTRVKEFRRRRGRGTESKGWTGCGIFQFSKTFAIRFYIISPEQKVA